MKKFYALLICLVTTLVLLTSCSEKNHPTCQIELTSTESSISYSLSFDDLNKKQTSYKILVLNASNTVKEEVADVSITKGRINGLEMNKDYEVGVFVTGKKEYDNCLVTKNITTKKGTIQGVIFNDEQYVYDGNVKSLKVENLPDGATVRYTGNDVSSVGEHTVTAVVSKENYEDLTLQAVLYISKASYDFILVDSTVTYDGNSHSINVDTELPLTYEYYNGDEKLESAPVNAGTYKVKAIYAGDETHTELVKEATLTINKATVDFEFKNSNQTYDGNSHSIKADTELPLTYEYYNGEEKLESAPVNAGTYKVKAIYAGDDNHKELVKEATLTINKANVTIEQANIDIKYNENYELNPVCSLANATLTITYYNGEEKLESKPTEIGIYKAIIVYAGDENYEECSKEVTINIKNPDYKNVIITLNPISTVYLSSYDVLPTVDNGLTLSDLIIKYYTSTEQELSEKPVNAGTYKIKVFYNGSDELFLNSAATDFVDLVIEKATYDLSQIKFEDRTVVYDGNEHKLEIDGTLPYGLSVSYSSNKLTNIGSIVVTATFIGDFDNYNYVSPMTAELTVKKQELSFTQTTQLKYQDTIDITNLLQYFTYSGISEEEYNKIKDSIILTKPDELIEIVNAGRYQLNISFAGNEFIEALDLDIELVVAKATHEIVLSGLQDNTITRVAKTTFNYTENAQTDTLYTYSIDLKNKPAGTYNVVISYEGNENIESTSINITVVLTEPTAATDLFISEYYEGKSNNKFIVLYNGTGKTLSLSEYKLAGALNGALFSLSSSQKNLSEIGCAGTLETNKKLAICNKQISNEIKSALEAAGCIVVVTSDSNTCNFNGDDTVVLLHNDKIIDVFGHANGTDPGTGWVFANISNATVDHHFVRASYVFYPTALYDDGYKWNEEEWICYSDLEDFTMTENYQMNINANKVLDFNLVLDNTEYSKLPTISNMIIGYVSYLPSLSYFTKNGDVYTKLDENPTTPGIYYIGYESQNVTISGEEVLLEAKYAEFLFGNNQYVNGYLNGSSQYISAYDDTNIDYTSNGYDLVFKQNTGNGFVVSYNGTDYESTQVDGVHQVSFTLTGVGKYVYDVSAVSGNGYISYTHKYTVNINKAAFPAVTTEYSTDNTTYQEYNEILDAGTYYIKITSAVEFKVSCASLDLTDVNATLTEDVYSVIIENVTASISIQITSLNESYNSPASIGISIKSSDPNESIEKVYDLKTNFNTYNKDWGTSYGERTISSTDLGTDLPEASIKFDNCSKQNSTITDMPVCAAKKNTTYVTLELTDSNYILESFSFDLIQWTTKKFTDIHLEYFNGSEWVSCSEVITTPSKLECNTTLTGVTKVRVAITTTNTSNVQIGISSITLKLKQA